MGGKVLFARSLGDLMDAATGVDIVRGLGFVAVAMLAQVSESASDVLSPREDGGEDERSLAVLMLGGRDRVRTVEPAMWAHLCALRALTESREGVERALWARLAEFSPADANMLAILVAHDDRVRMESRERKAVDVAIQKQIDSGGDDEG